MKPLPTDLEILDSIYERYYLQFANDQRGADSDRNFVEIDIPDIARELQVDSDIVFGRLYYHLDRKYRYRNDKNERIVVFFTTKGEIGRSGDLVNFPYMASVLADLRAEDKRHRTTNWLSMCALVISIVAIIVSIFARK